MVLTRYTLCCPGFASVMKIEPFKSVAPLVKNSKDQHFTSNDTQNTVTQKCYECLFVWVCIGVKLCRCFWMFLYRMCFSVSLLMFLCVRIKRGNSRSDPFGPFSLLLRKQRNGPSQRVTRHSRAVNIWTLSVTKPKVGNCERVIITPSYGKVDFL